MSRYTVSEAGSSNGNPRILVFAGSTRSDSFNRKLARATAETLQRRGLQTTLADLRDYPMPIYDGDREAAEGIPPRAKAFKELLRSHDAFVIASPEYNGSFPALVKNVVDWASRPEPDEKSLEVFRGKTAALLSASPGAGGGQRGLRHLRELLEMIGVTVVGQQVTVPRAGDAFNADGALVRPVDIDAVARLVADVGQAVGLQQDVSGLLYAAANPQSRLAEVRHDRSLTRHGQAVAAPKEAVDFTVLTEPRAPWPVAGSASGPSDELRLEA